MTSRGIIRPSTSSNTNNSNANQLLASSGYFVNGNNTNNQPQRPATTARSAGGGASSLYVLGEGSGSMMLSRGTANSDASVTGILPSGSFSKQIPHSSARTTTATAPKNNTNNTSTNTNTARPSTSTRQQQQQERLHLSTGPAAFLRESLLVAAPPPSRSARTANGTTRSFRNTSRDQQQQSFRRNDTTTARRKSSSTLNNNNPAGKAAEASWSSFGNTYSSNSYGSFNNPNNNANTEEAIENEKESMMISSFSKRPMSTREKRDRERQKQKEKRALQQRRFSEEQQRKNSKERDDSNSNSAHVNSRQQSQQRQDQEDDEYRQKQQHAEDLIKLQELLAQNQEIFREDGSLIEDVEASLMETFGGIPEVVSLAATVNNANSKNEAMMMNNSNNNNNNGITLKFSSNTKSNTKPLPPRQFFIASNRGNNNNNNTISSSSNNNYQQNSFSASVRGGMGNTAMMGYGQRIRVQDIQQQIERELQALKRQEKQMNQDQDQNQQNIINNNNSSPDGQSSFGSPILGDGTRHQPEGATLPTRSAGLLPDGSNAMISGQNAGKYYQENMEQLKKNIPPILTTAPTSTKTTQEEQDDDHNSNEPRPRTPPQNTNTSSDKKPFVRSQQQITSPIRQTNDPSASSSLFSGQSVFYTNALASSSSNINRQDEGQHATPRNQKGGSINNKSLPPSARRPMTSSSTGRSRGEAEDRLAGAVGGSILIGQQQIHSVTQYQELLDQQLKSMNSGNDNNLHHQSSPSASHHQHNNNNQYHSSNLRASQHHHHNNNRYEPPASSEMERVAELDPSYEVTPRSQRPQSARLSDLFNSLHGGGAIAQNNINNGNRHSSSARGGASARGPRKGALFRGIDNNNNNEDTSDQHQQHNNYDSPSSSVVQPLGLRRFSNNTNNSDQQNNNNGDTNDLSFFSSPRSHNNNNGGISLPAANGRPSTASKQDRKDFASSSNNTNNTVTLPNFMAPTVTGSYGKVVGSNAFDQSRLASDADKQEDSGKGPGKKQLTTNLRRKNSTNNNNRASSKNSRPSSTSSANNNNRKSSPTTAKSRTPNQNTADTFEKFHNKKPSTSSPSNNNTNNSRNDNPNNAIANASSSSSPKKVTDTIDHNQFFGLDSGKVKMHELPGSAFDQRPNTVVMTDNNNSNNNNRKNNSGGGDPQGSPTHPVNNAVAPQFGPRLSPGEALVQYENKLTRHEKFEILEIDDIYFVGAKVFHQKIQAPIEGAVNNGYDDERGEYNTVKGDHICYRYEVLSELGRGSFGQVLKVFDHKRQQQCALKLIRNKKRFRHQAQVEIRILDHLRSRDVEEKSCTVRMLNFFQFRDHVVITFELHAVNLFELSKLNKHMAFPMQLIRRFAGQLLVALAFLHKERIIHADMKPENILLRQENKTGLRVIDFGSSCFEGDATYQYIQSRFYRAPEVIMHLKYGRPIDAWSLGTILCEMQLGFPIFAGENEKEQMLCMMEVLGTPSKKIVDQMPSKRRAEFFEESALAEGKVMPKIAPSAKGKIKKPSSTSLKQVLGTSDDLFIDFVSGFLRWDPAERFTPQDGMNHPWIADLFTGKNNREGNVGSNHQSQLVTTSGKK